MIVKVSGQYRHDLPEHTEQGLKDYDIEFEILDGYRPGPILTRTQEILKEKDPTFDSLKTHHIEVIKQTDAGQ